MEGKIMSRNRIGMIALASLFLCLCLLSSCGDGDGEFRFGPFTWQIQSAPQGWHDLWGVSAVDTMHVWAVGRAGTILFYDGTDWTAQTSGTTHTLRAVLAVDAAHVWAVGEGGTILFYDGTDWTAQTSGTTHMLW
ncbi:MAG: hypothetical protein GY850_40705, partial [bacterium]|nr:hypothetical protein [bacterium]